MENQETALQSQLQEAVSATDLNAVRELCEVLNVLRLESSVRRGKRTYEVY